MGREFVCTHFRLGHEIIPSKCAWLDAKFRNCWIPSKYSRDLLFVSFIQLLSIAIKWFTRNTYNVISRKHKARVNTYFIYKIPL